MYRLLIGVCAFSLLSVRAESSASMRETADERARRGARLYERPATRAQGLELLKEADREGSPFAKARMAAFYYLGEAGFERDVEKALALMKSAVANGFPAGVLPLKQVEKDCVRLRRERTNPSSGNRIQKGGVYASRLLGNGFPGRIERYVAGPDLKHWLNKYGLQAGWFRRDADRVTSPPSVNEIPYLLFTPRSISRSVPMIVYFGGTGEQGTNLVKQFHQKTIFDEVTSDSFQKRHPCYLFVPMVPVGAQLRCGKTWRSPMADLVCDAMYALIRDAKIPRVDTNRLYLTGLSSGGSAAYTFSFGYPGRFAASLPIAGFATPGEVSDTKPGNIWLIGNRSEFETERMRTVISGVRSAVESRGGEFRLTILPGKGHNAWDQAWREPMVWDWMFSRTANGILPGAVVRPTLDLSQAKCSASNPGRDADSGPDRAVDGMESTCYVSGNSAIVGDWWRVDFPRPLSGRMEVWTGTADGREILVRGWVEVSADGQAWHRVGTIDGKTGACRFVSDAAIGALRVRSSRPQVMTIREVRVFAE